ncbi:hypothetical protein WK30_15735 [Burkholderia vietnamiensis]|nr:hypothetical protein WJ57_22490 [Burkholderia vietnamiensis]KVS01752.1 hypothetical protein WK30_15735 [Burkholderia vietnamiensis]
MLISVWIHTEVSVEDSHTAVILYPSGCKTSIDVDTRECPLSARKKSDIAKQFSHFIRVTVTDIQPRFVLALPKYLKSELVSVQSNIRAKNEIV